MKKLLVVLAFLAYTPSIVPTTPGIKTYAAFTAILAYGTVELTLNYLDKKTVAQRVYEKIKARLDKEQEASKEKCTI